jgi:signal transduction histidine kinase
LPRPFLSRVKTRLWLFLLLPAALTALLFWTIRENERTLDSARQTREVRTEVDALLFDLMSAESAARGYELSGQDSFLRAHKEAVSRGQAHLAKVEELVRSAAPNEVHKFQELKPLVQVKLESLSRNVERREFEGRSPEDAELDASDTETQRAEALAQEILDEQEKTLERLRISQSELILTLKLLAVAGLLITLFEVISLSRRVTLYAEQRDEKESELTELTQTLEHRVAERTAELEKANQELELFSHVAAHDLRSPVRTLGVLSDYLKKQYSANLPAKAQEMVELMETSAKRMSRLVDDLFTFHSVDASEVAVVDANKAVRNVLSSLQGLIQSSGARIESGTLPLVWSQETSLEQVFQNLIENAIKYRRKGVPPAIRISAETRNHEVIFQVQDNGQGFDTKYAQQIFDPFTRLHGSEYAGSGLGLATCAKIVKRQGGRIWADSTPGAGSVFYFSLPYVETEEHAAAV